MSKVTGIFLPNTSVRSKVIAKILQEASTRLNKLVKDGKEISCDKQSFHKAQVMVQNFQNNHGKKDTMITDDNKPKYPSIHWCANGALCSNKVFPPNRRLACSICKLAVHTSCGKIDNSEYKCFSCLNTKKSGNSTIVTPVAKNMLQTDDESTVRHANTISATTNNQRSAPKKNIFENKKQGDVWFTRFELRLSIPESLVEQRAVDRLYRMIVALIKELRKCDPTIQVIPWVESEALENMPLTKQYLPMQELHRFVNRVQAIESGQTWGDVRLKHTKPYSEILYETGLWLRAQGHGLFFKDLQVETARNVGWFLWSHRNIDAKLLAKELFRLYDIQVQFRYALIAVDNSPQFSANQVRALHIAAPIGPSYNKIKRTLQEVYGSTSKDFPLGIQLRYVPTAGRLGKSSIQIIKKLKQYQKDFSAAVEDNHIKSWEILNLDEPVGSLPSLRSLIMAVKSKEDPSANLFASVDTAYNRSELVLFSYIPIFEDEARAFVGNLIPYILKEYGDASHPYFNSEALLLAQDSAWDIEKQEFVTNDDKWVESLDDLTGFEWLASEKDEDLPEQKQVIVTTPAMRKMQRVFLRQDANSTGTFSSRNKSSGLQSIGERQVVDLDSNVVSGSATTAIVVCRRTLDCPNWKTTCFQYNKMILCLKTLNHHLTS